MVMKTLEQISRMMVRIGGSVNQLISWPGHEETG